MVLFFWSESKNTYRAHSLDSAFPIQTAVCQINCDLNKCSRLYCHYLLFSTQCWTFDWSSYYYSAYSSQQRLTAIMIMIIIIIIVILGATLSASPFAFFVMNINYGRRDRELIMREKEAAVIQHVFKECYIAYSFSHCVSFHTLRIRVRSTRVAIAGLDIENTIISERFNPETIPISYIIR